MLDTYVSDTSWSTHDPVLSSKAVWSSADSFKADVNLNPIAASVLPYTRDNLCRGVKRGEMGVKNENR